MNRYGSIHCGSPWTWIARINSYALSYWFVIHLNNMDAQLSHVVRGIDRADPLRIISSKLEIGRIWWSTNKRPVLLIMFSRPHMLLPSCLLLPLSFQEKVLDHHKSLWTSSLGPKMLGTLLARTKNIIARGSWEIYEMHPSILFPPFLHLGVQ